MSQQQIYEALMELKQGMGELKGGQARIIAHQERQNSLLDKHEKRLDSDQAAIKFLKWGGSILMTLLTAGAVLWAALAG